MSKFSENLKQLREKAGMTRLDLANACGLSNTAIGQYETGKREPQANTLIAIATALHVSTDTLLGYQVNEYAHIVEQVTQAGFEVATVKNGTHIKITANDEIKKKAEIYFKKGTIHSLTMPIDDFSMLAKHARECITDSPIYQEMYLRNLLTLFLTYTFDKLKGEE